MLCGGGKRNPFASVFVLFLGFMFVILHIVKNRVVLVLYVKWSLSNLSNELLRSPSLHSNQVQNYDITVLTHTSIQRLFFIPYIVNRWGGPISITIYMKSDEEKETVNSLIHNDFFPQTVTVHQYLSSIPTEYPYNRLRNLSLRGVTTSHFWVMDMDMWPSDNLYSTLLSLDTRFLSDSYLAVIVPSFEYKNDISNCVGFRECVNTVIPFIPHTMADLLNCLALEKCEEFRKDYFVHNYLTPQWYDHRVTQQLLFVPCFKSYKQEPYVMVKRSDHLPVFDERFINYGKDKISWIENLRYDGYQFAVLKGAFAIDIPHPRSTFAKKFFDVLANEGAENWDMNVAYTEFKKELMKKKDNSVVYFCDESGNAQ